MVILHSFKDSISDLWHVQTLHWLREIHSFGKWSIVVRDYKSICEPYTRIYIINTSTENTKSNHSAV